MQRDLRKSLPRLGREGFRKVHVLRGPEEIDASEIRYEKLYNDRKELTGPFDTIGDVHGCRAELELLLTRLGWTLHRDAGDRPVNATHPDGRTAVFVGDLVTACRSATRGRATTAARPWSSTVTPRRPPPSGSTTPSASTRGACSAGR